MNAVSLVMGSDLACRPVSVALPPNANVDGTLGAWENVVRCRRIRMVGRYSLAETSVMRLDWQGAWAGSRT
jgi:hypothetical protein